jgi:hypothetical protein
MAGGRATLLRKKYSDEAKARMREAAVRGNKTRHGKDAPAVENFPQPDS